MRIYSYVFFTGFIAHFNEYHEHEFQCKDGSTPKFLGGGFDQVVAVIGAQSSSVTIQVSFLCLAETHLKSLCYGYACLRSVAPEYL